jgi:hypothetical protein
MAALVTSVNKKLVTGTKYGNLEHITNFRVKMAMVGSESPMGL